MPGYPLDQILRAQAALRSAAGLPPEQFPAPAFVGMISDEIEALRNSGRSDADIADIIRESSGIEISPETLSANYAPPEKRHPPE